MEKRAINTQTQQEYDALMRWYEGKWGEYKGEGLNKWGIYGQNTCVSENPHLRMLRVAGRNEYEIMNYEVIPFTQFAKENSIEY